MGLKPCVPEDADLVTLQALDNLVPTSPTLSAPPHLFSKLTQCHPPVCMPQPAASPGCLPPLPGMILPCPPAAQLPRAKIQNCQPPIPWSGIVSGYPRPGDLQGNRSKKGQRLVEPFPGKFKEDIRGGRTYLQWGIFFRMRWVVGGSTDEWQVLHTTDGCFLQYTNQLRPVLFPGATIICNLQEWFANGKTGLISRDVKLCCAPDDTKTHSYCQWGRPVKARKESDQLWIKKKLPRIETDRMPSNL